MAKAVSSLARYIVATTLSSSEISEGAGVELEQSRDLSVEIEGDDSDASDEERRLARVLAGIAVAMAGEVEEALEASGLSGRNQESAETCVSLPVYPLPASPPSQKLGSP